MLDGFAKSNVKWKPKRSLARAWRRCERAMLRFRRMKTLQKFASICAKVHNHFNQERRLLDPQTHKQRHSVALAEW